MIEKLVHSFWTEPYRNSNFRMNGGFKNQYYFLLSSVLSFFSFKKNFDDVTFELVTDDRGKEMLVDLLGLPYDSVDLKLNDVTAQSEIWSIGKLYAFQQDRPFLHVDLDTFLFKPMSKELLASDIIVANNESNYNIYNNIMTDLSKHVKVYDNVYKAAIKDFQQHNYVNSVNMGIFGGTNTKLIKEYVQKSLKMYELNKKYLTYNNRSGITCFIEQIYLMYFLMEKKVKPTCFIKGNWMDATKHIEDAHKKGFTHLVSESKRNNHVLNLLEQRVQKDYPEYFEKLQEVKKRSIEVYDMKIK